VGPPFSFARKAAALPHLCNNPGQNADAGAIISAVVRLGHAMGLQATRVETVDQQDFLKVTGPVLAHQLRDSIGRPAVEETA
jgi:hypothetical protein